MTEELSQGPYKRDIADIEPSPPSAANYDAPSSFPVTKLILALNVLVFVLMAVVSGGESIMYPSSQTLLQWGADHGPETLTQEQYWRIVSNMFLHIGLMHIALNMYALWNVGPAVERFFGSGRMIFVYLIAGIGGSLTSLWFHPEILSAGASGAIFGIFGALLAFLRFHAAQFDKSYVVSATRSMVILLIVNLIWGFSTPGIDNAAHVGGFITGVVAALACMPKTVNTREWTAGTVASCFLVVLVLYGVLHLRVESYDRMVSPSQL